MNTVNIIGNLTRDPEVKRFDSGASATISIASNNRYRKNDEWVNKPTFVDVRVVGGSADNAEKYLKKGSKVAITGRLDMDSWEDKDTGQKRSRLYIFGTNVEYLDPKSESTGSAPKSQSAPQKQTQDDDVPW
jgi:single-strand DNA-binding protein